MRIIKKGNIKLLDGTETKVEPGDIFVDINGDASIFTLWSRKDQFDKDLDWY